MEKSIVNKEDCGLEGVEHLLKVLKDGKLLKKLRAENSKLKRDLARLRKENKQLKDK